MKSSGNRKGRKKLLNLMEELAVNSNIFYSVLAFYELISYLKSFNPFGERWSSYRMTIVTL
ncbi:hypothetical protein GA421_01585 [Bacteroides xylanisolvens]|uniref:Uncharacterized protein n=1 Tax=Bacteroides xylanisolvens TaxID=371601 RepID=A0A6A2RTW6_9BACE|nr:hypothetical protein GA402_00930 [Bacteroides xylanisolvens]KAB6111140.1 hypothetical protein GA406_01560 [Bacteroides xylanisolvens]KAB6112947.1 hypothetical protein GA431_20005 [Bacteroides xylanisolvens]KAB6125720.1 hypothetical protein GA439_01945 [Bacteroides xylanisolvens]KAB6131461.1 hypothetical protein GA432_01590 [Bacteroides xylanisolvens]